MLLSVCLQIGKGIKRKILKHMRNISSMLFIAISCFYGQLSAQMMHKEELIYLTSEWKGERFDDGRPKIPDDLLERAKQITIEDAWLVLRNEGYVCQFEGNFKVANPNGVMTGRAVTARFLPSRPDLENLIKKRGWEEGFQGNTNSWPIEKLQEGDVYVADGGGKIIGGTLIGDNLASSIFKRSGNGVIFNCSARDPEGISQIDGFNAWIRDWDPSFLENAVLTGLNIPITLGRSIVMPGDLVLAKNEGVIFIPAHLAQKVVIKAEFLSLRAEFANAVLSEGRFTAGQIDNQWTDEIKNAFLKWIDLNPGRLPMKKEELDEFMKKRTW